jgi:hypothetical protein
VTQHASIGVMQHDGIQLSISGCEWRAKGVFPTPVHVPVPVAVSLTDLYGWYQECQCFACAGARLHEAVHSLQNHRDRLCLNLGHVPAIMSGQATGKSKVQIRSRMVSI